MSTKRSDFASGLVYFGYRFYEPHLGRWLNRDPLQEQGGINLYGYVQGDPLGYVDPDGQYAQALGAITGGVVAGPSGAVIGTALGTGIGVAICVYTDICQFNDSADDSASTDGNNKVDPCPADVPKSEGKRRKNRIPDKGEPGTVSENPAGTTRKKYGRDGNVQK